MKSSKVVSLLSIATMLVAMNAFLLDANVAPRALDESVESSLLAGQDADRKGLCDLNATCQACRPFTQCSPTGGFFWVSYAGPFGLGGWVWIKYCLGTGGNDGCEQTGTVKICRRFCTLTETCGNNRTDCGRYDSRRCSDFVQNPPPNTGNCSNQNCGYRGGDCANCG